MTDCTVLYTAIFTLHFAAELHSSVWKVLPVVGLSSRFALSCSRPLVTYGARLGSVHAVPCKFATCIFGACSLSSPTTCRTSNALGCRPIRLYDFDALVWIYDGSRSGGDFSCSRLVIAIFGIHSEAAYLCV